MLKIGVTLAGLRKENGYSQQQVAEYLTGCGYAATQKAVSKWEKDMTVPNAHQFLLLCKLYEAQDILSTFLGTTGPLSSLNPEGRRRVKEYVRLLGRDSEFAASRAEEIPFSRTLPLYELPVSAGTGQFLDSADYTLLRVDESVPLSATFAVRISGDSMTPRFVNRQIVYIKQQQTLEPGEIGIFLLNGDGYCKQLGMDGSHISLISLNQAKYPSIVITPEDELRVLGKVVS